MPDTDLNRDNDIARIIPDCDPVLLAEAPLFRLIQQVIPDPENPENGLATLGEALRGLQVDQTVYIDGRRRPLPADVFYEQAFRCTENGLPVCRASVKDLTRQRHELDHAKQMIQPTPDLDRHYADLVALRARHPEIASTIADPETRIDIMSYDVLDCGARDNRVTQADLAAIVPEEPRDPLLDPVLRRIEAETRISPEEWVYAIERPEFKVEAVRALARDMLSPLFGNAADLEDARMLLLDRAEVERINRLRAWIKSDPSSKTLAPFQHRMVPGYKTSEPLFNDKDGVALVFFEDTMAAYAYTWQSNPDLKLNIDPPDEPDPWKFGL